MGRRLLRYLHAAVRRDLARKMVFVAGPRQVGKTTLALSLPGASGGYLNWDVAAHRERILRGELPPARLWILDEIHKYRRWRNYPKGLYDGRPRGQKVLVTGSGRLNSTASVGTRCRAATTCSACIRFPSPNSAFPLRAIFTSCSGWAAFPSRTSRAARPRPGAGRASTARCSCARKSPRSSASRTWGISSS